MDEPATLDSAWRAVYDAARAPWPGVELPAAAFVGRVHSKGLREPDATQHWADVYLAVACEDSGRSAVAHVDALVEHAGAAVARVDARPDFVADVLQQVRERLLVGPSPRIASYRGRGTLQGFIVVTATRAALNLRREQGRAADAPEDGWAMMLGAVDTADVELEALKARHRPAFSDALRGACRDITERERTVLRLYFFEEQGVDRLAALFGVHRATAARWVHRAKDALHDAARQRLKASEQLDTAEASLIERLVHSQLSVSFSGLREGAREA